jgi:3-hydroxyisobutyrate dehydrogenase
MTSPASTVAFLGLGNMGGPMAANLVAAGIAVRGFDPSSAATAAAARSGVVTCDSPAEAATAADVVVTMLPSGRHVLDLYREHGLLEAVGPGALFIDSSTIDVADAQLAHELAVAAGCRMIDAPVSGGVVGATAASLTFMVGGEQADVEAAAPYLDAMGARTVHCGPSGTGQAAKACNNLVLAISMLAVSEGFVLGEALGLSAQALFDVVSTSSGNCWALSANCPVPDLVPTSPSSRGFEGGFAAALMTKDLRLVADAAERHGIVLDLGQQALTAYAALAHDRPDVDFSAVIDAVRGRPTTSQEPPDA